MKDIDKKITIHFTYATLALILVAFVIGYSFGNFYPVSGKIVQTNAGSQPTQGDSGSGSGVIQISNPFDDDPIIGDRKAPVIIIEFSDFQCPFCRRFYTQTLTQVESDYIKTGKAVLVYRDFPLDSIHPAALPSALAAQCANEQGKWREFHDKIFNEQGKQGSGTVDYSSSDIKKWASEISGIDSGKFDQCLDSQKYLQEVQADFQDGVKFGVTGTPTFYIGNAQKGFTQVVGAQPFSAIKSAIDSYL